MKKLKRLKKKSSSNKMYAFGGTVDSIDDLDEDELAALQEEADANGVSVEEMFDMKNQQNDHTNIDSTDGDDTFNDTTDNENLDNTDDGTGDIFAYGGRMRTNAEVEGGEVMQTPNGNMHQVVGPSHENGGVDVDVPHGTDVYSDRLTLDGKSMAQRKLFRERKLNTLTKLYKNSSNDKLIKNTLERTQQNFDSEDAQDMQMQQIAAKVYAPPTLKKKMAFGGTAGDDIFNMYNPYGTSNIPTDYLVPFTQPLGGLANFDMSNGSTGIGALSAPTSFSGTTPNMIANPVDYGTVANPALSDNSMSLGEGIGLAGNVFGAVAPLLNTINNAKNTKPNINRFAGFGQNALNDNSSAQDFASTMLASRNRQIGTNSNTAIARNRNSASSVNVQRALDSNTAINTDNAYQSANDSFSNEMVGLMGQRANLDNAADSQRMAGAKQVDIENKQDQDNLSTNLGADYANIANTAQNIGRNLNKSNQNNVNRNLVNSQSKNGIAVDKEGNIVNQNLSREQIQQGLAAGTLVYDNEGNIVSFRSKVKSR